MASAASPTSLSLRPSSSPSASPSSSRRQAAAVAFPASHGAVALRSPVHRLGFAGAAADPLLAIHVAARIRAVAGRSGRGPRGVAAMAKKSVGDLTATDLKGKRVFMRADLNVPLDENQNITDDTRIRAAVPTIKHLMGNGAKVILSSHLGRPKGVTPKYSLSPLVPRLSELLGIKVEKADDCIGPEVEKMVAALPEGGVLLLENVRFYKEEEKNEPEFAKKLASLADLYVNDAFGTAHRAHASTEGVTKFLKPSVAGFLLQKLELYLVHLCHLNVAFEELDYLVGAVTNPKRPFAAIIGGSKVSSKIGVIESLLEKCDILLLGGGMIFTFYKAQGLSVGSSLVEEDKLDLATSLLKKAKSKGVSLMLPTDVVIADKFAADANSKVVPSTAIPDGWMGLDIGPDSVKSFSDALETTKTVIWNGPMGVFEFDKFAVGTEAIAKKLAELSGKGVTTIIGGGDSVAAVEKVGVADVMSHISTGGGASLELLEGKELPGVVALDEAVPVAV
ncbi:phosphoglycerate kinase, cytosolic [Cocos nucifera]|nr:phosphoglycerate kinase, cytosolic [Cocos nucifera]